MEVNHFLRLVREELDSIKVNATKKEIDRLDFSTFLHDSKSKCIYGQMTGDCHSKRATEIMGKNLILIVTENPKENSELHLNIFEPEKASNHYYPRFTYLEQYLFWSNKSTHEKIFSYLKGEIDDITLELEI